MLQCCQGARASERRKLRPAARGEGLLDAADLLRAQLQPDGARVLLDVDAARRLGNGERPREAGQERQRDLPRRLAMRARDRGQDLTARRSRSRERAGTERAVSDERRSELLAKRDEPGIRVPLLEVVERLIAGDAARTGERDGFS